MTRLNAKKPELNDRDWLETQYITLGLSCQAIGKILDVNESSVRRYMLKLGIPLRDNHRKGKLNKTYKDNSYLLGRKTDMLEVIGFDKNLVICKCNCGNVVNLQKRRITYDKQKSCGCLMTNKGINHFRWKGGKYVSAAYLSKLKSDAKRRGLDFNISVHDVDSIFEAQNFKCSISNVDISFIEETASIDRIDSSRGYEPDNIQILHKRVNEMKWDYEQQDFIKWCKLIARHST